MHFTKKELVETIKSLYETDVGDFKRKLLLYLNRFAEGPCSEEQKSRIQEIKNFAINMEANFKGEMENIDKIRFALLEQLKDL